MSVRGWVQACEWQPRGSELVADAAEDAITITVENLTEFDDAGGIISINDQTISYDRGAIDEDAGTILLNTGLAEAATIGDAVSAVSGGEIMRDVVLFVDCGDGEPVEVRVNWEQRDYWAEGDYDNPVQIILSNDLERIEDVPGRAPRSTEVAEVRGGYDGSLQDIYDAADAAATAAADAAANATTALTAANGKNKTWVSLSSPGSTPNTAGDIWFRKDSGTQTIIGQWEGLGGTSWQQVTLNDAVIANLDAGKLVAGSAFTNALSVKTNFTLGDASTNGVIQSYNFAGSSVGIYIDKFGIVAKGGSLAAVAITGSSFTTSGNELVISASAIAWNGGSFIQEAGSQLQLSNGGAGAVLIGSGGVTLTGAASASGGLSVSSGLGVTGATTLQSTTLSGALGMGGNNINSAGAVNCTSVASSGAIIDSGLAGAFADASINTNGRAVRTTSSERFKTDITPVEFDEVSVLAMQEVTFRYIDEETNGPGVQVGLIAEQLIDCGMGQFVFYDQDDQPEGIHYPKLTAALLNVIRKHRTVLDELIVRIELLETP